MTTYEARALSTKTAQPPADNGVPTWWPCSARARSTGRCSSRRTRTSQERGSARGRVPGDRLLASDGW